MLKTQYILFLAREKLYLSGIYHFTDNVMSQLKVDHMGRKLSILIFTLRDFLPVGQSLRDTLENIKVEFFLRNIICLTIVSLLPPSLQDNSGMKV